MKYIKRRELFESDLKKHDDWSFRASRAKKALGNLIAAVGSNAVPSGSIVFAKGISVDDAVSKATAAGYVSQESTYGNLLSKDGQFFMVDSTSDSVTRIAVLDDFHIITYEGLKKVVFFDGATIVEASFEKSDLLQRGEAYDEPWSYVITSTKSSDGKHYEGSASYYGDPEFNQDFDSIEEVYPAEK